MFFFGGLLWVLMLRWWVRYKQVVNYLQEHLNAAA